MGVSATITQNLIDKTAHAAYKLYHYRVGVFFATLQLSSDESHVVYSQLWYAVALVDQAIPIHFQLKTNVSINSVKRFADLINTISGPN